ncbi:MAG: M15 family metallopeptidase, partial [Spirochaetaceae bacterium]|nr:M15 family metallopeptidase [Spirochaetaceae bacterium]
LKTGRDDITLDRKAAEALVRLSKAAEAEGLTLRISSAYRSYEYQQALFNRYSERDGEAAASRYSARAGTSQHQLGTTVDFGSITNNFAISAEGIWMEENAGRFGWSLSYPREMEEETGYMWESWHWRWIGTDAVIMQKNFFDGVQQRMLVFWNENATEMRKALMKDID